MKQPEIQRCAQISGQRKLGRRPPRSSSVPHRKPNDPAPKPQIVPGIDVRALSIGPEEAFVLSRLDGESDLAELAAATGLPEDRVRRALERLVEVGAVDFRAPPVSRATAFPRGACSIRPAPAPAPAPAGRASVTPEASAKAHGPTPPQPSAGRVSRPAMETVVAGAEPGHSAAALYDPAELDEAVDLDLPKKRAILDLFYRLDSVTHYDVLNVDSGADKKTIKNAYYDVVGTFHPDKFFGKNLGSFKPKMERLFTRLTEAHDVLTRNQSRTEYDQYLATQRRNRDIERLIVDDQLHSRELELVRQRIEQEARIAEHVESAAIPQRVTGAPPPTHSLPPQVPLTASSSRGIPPTIPPPPDRVSSPSQTFPSVPAMDPEARRRALARKLAARSTHPPGPPSQPPPPTAESRESLSADLRRRYEHRVLEARNNQVRQYVVAADQAAAQGNLVSATNALRIAVSLAPDDVLLMQRLEESRHRANAELANSFVEQARYEEQHARWAEAARSYERATLGKQSGNLHERVAHCLLEARGDLRAASEHAKMAVQLDPNVASHHLVMGRVYLAAGMKQSALAALERAQRIAPADETIQGWLRRARRGEV